MTSTESAAGARRRNASGESTRVMLMEVAERLFATRGIEAVTLREIQQAAGQSNTSVIRYHFGSRDGLIRALISYRQASLGTDRQEMLASMREEGKEADPRAVVWLLVRPLANSIAAGEMFAPFLARLAEDPRARSDVLAGSRRRRLDAGEAGGTGRRRATGPARADPAWPDISAVHQPDQRAGRRRPRRAWPQRSAAAQLRGHLGRNADGAGVVRNARADRRRRTDPSAAAHDLLGPQVGDRGLVQSDFAQHRIGVLPDGASRVGPCA